MYIGFSPHNWQKLLFWKLAVKKTMQKSDVLGSKLFFMYKKKRADLKKNFLVIILLLNFSELHTNYGLPCIIYKCNLMNINVMYMSNDW